MKESVLEAYAAMVRCSSPGKTRGLDDAGVISLAVAEEEDTEVLYELLGAFELELTELLLNTRRKRRKFWYRMLFDARNRKTTPKEVVYEKTIAEIRERIAEVRERIDEIEQCGW